MLDRILCAGNRKSFEENYYWTPPVMVMEGMEKPTGELYSLVFLIRLYCKILYSCLTISYIYDFAELSSRFSWSCKYIQIYIHQDYAAIKTIHCMICMHRCLEITMIATMLQSKLTQHIRTRLQKIAYRDWVRTVYYCCSVQTHGCWQSEVWPLFS